MQDEIIAEVRYRIDGNRLIRFASGSIGPAEWIFDTPQMAEEALAAMRRFYASLTMPING